MTRQIDEEVNIILFTSDIPQGKRPDFYSDVC